MTPWTQLYNPLHSLPLSALAAAIPLAALLWLLAVRRAAGQAAAAAGLACALALAVGLWEMPWRAALSAGLLGAAFGLFPIVWVVASAIWIYDMTVESGAFDVIRRTLAQLTEDRRLQAICVAYAFSAFMEGAAGFGTPVAIGAAMLAGLGFSPLLAAGVCLVANSAPAAFGAVGIPILVAADTAGLDARVLAEMTARQLAGLSFLLPLWICAMLCGLRRALEVWPALLVGGLSFSLTMYLTARFSGPALPDIAAGLVCLAALIALFKVWRPRRVWRFAHDGDPSVEQNARNAPAACGPLRAWAPFALMTAAVCVCGLESYRALVAPLAASLEWPWLHGLALRMPPVLEAAAPYSALFRLDVAGAAGTAVFAAGLASSFILPDYGPRKALRRFGRTCAQLRGSILTIVLVLALASVMNYAGMSSTLGLALTGTGALFPLLSPVVGWLGVFLTGSDTSANALFSGLQKTGSAALGLDPHLGVVANATGGVSGKMISPQSISVATAATGRSGDEGALFRFALGHSLLMLLIVCVITLAQALL